MLKNYCRIAWRHLLKQKMYAAIKIGGFALGIAACLLIFLYIMHELSYDRHYPHADRIYRVIGVYNDKGNIQKGNDWPAPMVTALKNDYPEVEKAGRYLESPGWGDAGDSQVRRAGQAENTYEEGLVYADQELLDILQPPFIYGNPAQALAAPRTIVITRRKAEKYFPGENPVGKLLILNNKTDKPYRIGGVIADYPSTSHFRYDFLITLEGIEFWPGEQTSWGASNYTTYVLLKQGTAIAAQEKKMSDGIIKNYFIPAMQEAGNVEAASLAENASLVLQPVTDIHLRSADIRDRLHHGDIRLVWLFGAVAVFILLIACINFINLATARSAGRAKEVGLRKAIGAERTGLIRQFLTESLLYSFLSFVLGIALAWLLLPYFNALASGSLSIPWAKWWFAPGILVAIVIVGITAGLYPAFYLSSFKPVQALKGVLARGGKGAATRSVLVVFQFTASVILVIGTLVIYRQMNYMLHKKLGFNKEQVLMIQGAGTLGDRAQAFKQALLQVPGVESATVSGYFPIEGTRRDQNPFWKEGMRETESGIGAQKWSVDHDYIKTMGMKIVAGRNFSAEMPTDSQAIIINQAMARQLQLKDPVGKRVTNSWQTWPVIGVMEDFHFESMKQTIGPLCLVLGGSRDNVAVKVSTVNLQTLIGAVTAVWKDYAPHQPIRYTFLDESFARMYADVQRTGRIFTTFSILAVIVACLGLLGLSAFMAEQRTKEIGIRKVLGASVQHLVVLLSKDFLKLVLVAVILAAPLAWFAMGQWLENFAYRADIRWDVFVMAGLLAVTIALLTVSFQSIKAALMNPVRSLRSE
ncbi:ABC transporter permease [Chitinophaga japonensis]|uniref:Putative ABC transport system permease protein n=1 Tax=Chitinophaga japonensis TaxID=104662 RepID=A0A562SRU3_CHIJA|nr:ABC transporter permease [Chitinophaga japonensis]TWI83977.1 putative ABC transport system permease protein [Chitinophaga japonensis]